MIYYYNNKEEIQEYNKKYWSENKEKIAEKRKRNIITNKELIIQIQQLLTILHYILISLEFKTF